ncbi:MAG TPA: DUF6097 family protein [Enterobacteriaceae bacterium]|nr:DUF6097 family protein [Enterobacteriaceae bacterium]
MGIFSNTRQLKKLHQHIEEKCLPVVSKDELVPQVQELERYLGRTDFTALRARKRVANVLTAIVSLPVLGYGAIIGLDRYFAFEAGGFNARQVTLDIAQWLADNMTGLGVYGVLFLVITFYYRWIDFCIGRKVKNVIKQFMTQTGGL